MDGLEDELFKNELLDFVLNKFGLFSWGGVVTVVDWVVALVAMVLMLVLELVFRRVLDEGGDVVFRSRAFKNRLGKSLKPGN